MIKVDQIERIRKLVLVEGLSHRAAAKEAGVSRHAVRVALAGPMQRTYNLTKPKPRSVSAAVEPIVASMLESDVGKPKKQQHTARRVFERLCDEYGFQGSEPTVRRIVAALRRKSAEVFIPLAYDPGQEAQVDFGEAEVVVNGKIQKVFLFCIKLCYSRMPFVMAFPHQRQEAFFEGHVAAFDFFGGVPRRLTYDNLKVAVRRILEGHNRQEQEAFIALRAHYLFDSHFCNPESGNEKGQVESLVGYVRRHALVPRPEVRSLAELNERLLAWCKKQPGRTVAGTSEPIGTRLPADKQALLPLPARPFDAARKVLCKVNRYAQVTYDTCTYSVPWRYAYRQVTVKAYVERIEVWADQERIAVHQRSYERNGTVLSLDHYLEVFLSKPGALQYAIPYKQALLPESYQQFYKRLKRVEPRVADRELVQVLLLHREHGAEAVHEAVQQAVQRQCCRAETVKMLLTMQRAEELVVPAVGSGGSKPIASVGLPRVTTAHYGHLVPKGGVVH